MYSKLIFILFKYIFYLCLISVNCLQICSKILRNFVSWYPFWVENGIVRSVKQKFDLVTSN